MKKFIAWVVALFLVVAAGASYFYVKHAEQQRTIELKQDAKKAKQLHSNHLRYPIDWHKSSQTIKYPEIKNSRVDELKVKVSLAKQKLYLYSKNKKIYTMYISASWQKNKQADRVLPGTYQLRGNRGEFYYNPATNQGGKYWIAWKESGKNLIQSVPTNVNRDFISTEAASLGDQKDIPNTQGNIWLSVRDAKWFYRNIPANTTMLIERN